jgi:tetratricopeptide (TPR) repeat protein
MAGHDLSIHELEGFLRDPDQLARPRRAEVVRHLAARCAGCQEHLRAAGWPEERRIQLLDLARAASGWFDELDSSQPGMEYESAFAAASASLTGFLSSEGPLSEAADALAAELLNLPEKEGLRSAGSDRRFAHPEVVRELIELSHSVRYDDPARTLQLADLARRIADICSIEAAGSDLRLADIRVRGWMQYGNALRVCGRLHESDDALTVAQKLRTAGTGDPLLRARLLDHLASLRTSQSRFRDAIEAADGAAQVYRALGERHNLAQSMLVKAIASLYAGETENGIRTLNRAIPLIDPEASPHLLLAACHNLIRGYIDLGQPEQALSLYYEVRDLYREFDTASTIRLRTVWQEGQLLRDLGHLSAAETALLEAREGFLERGIAYEVAVVSLDLASVYVRAGKLDELRRTVAEAVPIFSALHVGRETIAALLQLQQAAGKEQQALELIRLLNTRLAPLSQLPGK